MLGVRRKTLPEPVERPRSGQRSEPDLRGCWQRERKLGPCHDPGIGHDAPTLTKYVLAALALAAMLALAPFFIASGLMAPGWAVAFFVAIWLALFVVGCLWIRSRPLRVIPLPFVAAAVWFGGMTAGGELLGWTP